MTDTHARTATRAPAAFYTAVFAHFLALGLYLSVLQRYLTEELGTSKASVGLAIGVFFLAALVVRPPVGRMLDRTGPAPFLVWPLVALAVLSLAFQFATSPGMVIALRLLQGAFGAAFYVGAASLATELGGEARRATAVAWFSLAIYAGFALGPGLGELVVQRATVGVAWVVAAGCWLVAVVAIRRVAVPPRHVPADGEAPLTPMSGWRTIVHPAAVRPGMVLASITIAYVCVAGFSVLYADKLGLSGGAMYFTFAVSVFAVRLVSGGLADRIGRVTTALPGLVSALLGMLLLAAATPGPAVLAYVGTALFGVGHGLVFPALMAWAVDRAEPRERGAALGSFSAFGDAGQAVGGWAIGRIVDEAGFPAAYLTGGALCLAGALALVQPVRREVSRRAGRPPRG